MRIVLAISTLLFGAITLAQQIPPWMLKAHHRMVDGNELYSDCQNYETDVEITSDDKLQVTAKPGTDVYAAGACQGYIEGVVDSIPEGEGFEPAPDVKLSQYVDVVFGYLKDNPAQRHRQAYVLTRIALSQAFPETK